MAEPGISVPFRNADFGRFRKVGWILQNFKSVFTCVNMCPFLTRLVPLESSHSQLSNGTNFIKNGSKLRKLWRNWNIGVSNQFFRFPVWVPSWTAIFSSSVHKCIQIYLPNGTWVLLLTSCLSTVLQKRKNWQSRMGPKPEIGRIDWRLQYFYFVIHLPT